MPLSTSISDAWLGFSALAAFCTGRTPEWRDNWEAAPASIGGAASLSGITSIMLAGRELRDIALVCNNPLSPGIQPIIPLESAFEGACPWGVDVTCDVTTRPGWTVPAADWIASYMPGAVRDRPNPGSDPAVYRLIVGLPAGHYWRGTFTVLDSLGVTHRAFESYSSPLCTTTVRVGTTYAWPDGLPLDPTLEFTADPFLPAPCPQAALLLSTSGSSPPPVCP